MSFQSTELEFEPNATCNPNWNCELNYIKSYADVPLSYIDFGISFSYL